MSDPAFNPSETFPAATRAAWETLARDALAKLADLRTPDGLASRGLYTSEDASGRAVEPNPAWSPMVRSRITCADPKEANRQIKEEIASGAGGVLIVLDDAARSGDLAKAPGQNGVALRAVFDAAALLDGIDASTCGLDFVAGASAVALAQILGDLQATKRPELEKNLKGTLGGDPFGALARFGSHPGALDTALSEAAGLAAHIDGRVLGLRVFGASGLPYHTADATPAQEIAAVLAGGAAMLRALLVAGLALPRAAYHVTFSLAVDADFPASIVKLRALRRAWTRILELCGDGAAATQMRLAAVTSPRMMTAGDPQTNTLRTAIAAAAAIIGGADAVTVFPFTERLGSSAAARRLARNTALILLEEAGLARVADPAGGSFAFEAMTESLATEAWGAFQEIEREGGLGASLIAGKFQTRIAASAEIRRARYANGALSLIGVTHYAPPEAAPSTLEPPSAVTPPAPHKALAELQSRPPVRAIALPQIFDEDLPPEAVQ